MGNVQRKYTVLIVDDQPENIQVLSSHLYEKHLNIAIALSGQEALSIVARSHPDLILLDIMMPDMNGFEVCQQLHRDPKTCDIPVIFLTGKTQPEDIVAGFESGAVDYITKPFNSSELISRVCTHLELKRSRDLLDSQHRQLAAQHQELQGLYALSEQQYRRLAEHMADGVGILQQGRMVFANSALAAMLGYTPAQLCAIDPPDLVRGDYRDEFIREFLSSNQAGDRLPWQAPYFTVDQREIWAEIRHSMIEWEGTPGILLTARDITAQKLRDSENEQEKARLKSIAATLADTMKDRYRFGDIIGKSLVMQEVYELILRAAGSDANVVIYGESGTGKELVAWTIHYLSRRKDCVFAPVNCGAITESLFESEFFGHRKGAFTGASAEQLGSFSHADGGTLFLDEVGELSLAMQVKLLRALAVGEYKPVGQAAVKKADVRILAATNRKLNDLVAQGIMREDFFFRLHVIAITVPPLRERREDIPLLVDHLLAQYSPGQAKPQLPGAVIEQLYNYDWPGNVRELQNVLQRYLTTRQLDFADFGRTPRDMPVPVADVANTRVDWELRTALDAYERQYLLKALEQHRWHKGHTATALHIGQKTLYRKMKQHGLL